MKRTKRPVAQPRFTPTLRNVGISLMTLATLLVPIALTRGDENRSGSAVFLDPTGVLQVFDQNGAIDLTGPFFQNLGTNGRTCGTCHQPSDAEILARQALARGAGLH